MQEILCSFSMLKQAYDCESECYVLHGQDKDVYMLIFHSEEEKKTGIYTNELSVIRLYCVISWSDYERHSGQLTDAIECKIHEIMMKNFNERVVATQLFHDTPSDLVRPNLRLVMGRTNT